MFKKLALSGLILFSASTCVKADDILSHLFSQKKTAEQSNKKNRRTENGKERQNNVQSVIASFYGGGKGEKLASHTANGERFNASGLTCAHRSLKFGTKLLVSFHGRSVIVRVNDRGPAAYTGRGIDLSRGAAKVIGLTGVGKVQIARLN